MKLPMISLMKCSFLGFVCLTMMLAASPPPAPPVPSTPPSPAAAKPTSVTKLIDQAKASFEAGDFDSAIEFYKQAGDLLPLLPQISYNQAVANYRKGDFQRAAELFNEAILLSEDPELQNKARYNLGNAMYEQARPYMASETDPPDPPDPQQNAAQLEEATKGLEKALSHYKQAVNADPGDLDARHNAELSHQLLKQLRELQEQQQQQQQQDSQDQQEQQDQQQSQEKQQQDQEGQDQQDQQQQSQSQSGEEEQQQQLPQQSEGEEPKEEPQPQTTPDEQEGKDEQQEQPQSDAAHEESDRQPMSKEQAERLLQSVRDKERQRRSELARREAGKRSRVDKDW